MNNITLQNNIGICSSLEPAVIYLAETRDTLMDTEIYSRFVHNIENRFRRTPFYKDYKASLMQRGFVMSARHPNITAEMVDLEMHHEFIPLKYMTIMIIEHILNYKGAVTTNEVIGELVETHRRNEVAVTMLTVTDHQKHHADPSDFISIKQCAGNPFGFIDRYLDGCTYDIAMDMLLHLKQEKQYNGSYSPSELKARNQILSFHTEIQPQHMDI